MEPFSLQTSGELAHSQFLMGLSVGLSIVIGHRESIDKRVYLAVALEDKFMFNREPKELNATKGGTETKEV